MLFTLFITPIIVFRLGLKDYGIYILVSTIISMLGLLDLGLGTAVTKHMAFYFGRKDYTSMNRLAHSANSLFLVTAIMGVIITILAVCLGDYIFPEKFEVYRQYSFLILIAGLIFFFITINATSWATMIAIQRFDITTKVGMASTMLTSMSMLFAVLLGGSLISIFVLQLIITFLIAVLYFRIVRKILPEVTFGFKWDSAEIRKCYTFGIINFINNIATTSLISLDRIIIPFFSGPGGLTYYSMPGNIATKIPGMSNALSVSLFPAVSQLSGNDERERIVTLYTRSFRLITIMSGALTITAISFSYKTLLYWLDVNFADNSYKILILLALTNFILSLFGPLSNFLLGLGKLKFLSYSSIGMAVFNILLLFLLLPTYGIIGAAWAYLISVLPVFYFFFYTEKKYLNLRGRKSYYLKTFMGVIITSLATFLINLIIGIFVVNLASLLIIGGVSVIIYIILYKLLGFFEKEDWSDIEKFFSIFIERLKITLHI